MHLFHAIIDSLFTIFDNFNLIPLFITAGILLFIWFFVRNSRDGFTRNVCVIIIAGILISCWYKASNEITDRHVIIISDEFNSDKRQCIQDSMKKTRTELKLFIKAVVGCDYRLYNPFDGDIYPIGNMKKFNKKNYD